MMTKKCLLIVLMTLISIGAFAGPADDFLALDPAYEQNMQLDLPQGVIQDAVLQTKEAALTEQLIAAPEELGKVVAQASKLETGLLNRLTSRVQFKVTQEHLTSLEGSLSALRVALDDRNSPSSSLRGKKRIASIGGREVDLLDGEWRSTADGRQFWVSNEYSDIILTAADYRRYWAHSSSVED